MIRREAGFTLVELMITMVIFVFVIAAASQIFVGLLTQFKQQSTIAETNIEGIVGLNIMRRDIENAGYGLPWIWTHALLTSANEAVNDGATAHDDSAYNDLAVDAVPRAFVSGDGAGVSGSDVLVIKSASAAQNDASHKWTYVEVGNTVKEWDIETERPVTSDRMIVLSLSDTNRRELRFNTLGSFTATYVRNNPYLDVNPDSLSADFAPLETTDPRVVYGIDDPAGAALRMPFNRADFYVRTPGTMPTRCAAGTGILYKATVSQATGGLTELPLLDCVADFQVYYLLDADNDGTVESDSNDISLLTAQNIRDQLREIRVYILAHEGQRDRNYTFNNFTGAGATEIRVGQSAILGRDFDLATTITDYLNYRWKVYTIVVQTKNLR